MTYRVGPKGQVVIPKPLRDQLGLEPGDEVAFSLEGDRVALWRSTARSELQGRFAGARLIDALAAERAAERAREQGTAQL